LWRDPEPRQDPKWYGRYLSPDEIVDDMVKEILASPEAVKVWSDPESFNLAGLFTKDKKWRTDNPNAGKLFDVGQKIRNWYGLWHTECPYTEVENPVIGTKDNVPVITDPRFPDNLSAQIVERIRMRVTIHDLQRK
jgi:hypothetical protein